MHRIDSATAREDVNGIGKKGFSDNADLPQHDATYLTPRWLNAVQEEIANVIEFFGVELNPSDNTQLLSIIRDKLNDANNNMLNQIFDIDSVHISFNPNYNPAVELEPILGVTKWRKLPFLLNGVSSSNSIGKLTYLKSGADVAAVNANIWQRMPNDYVAPVANIFYNPSDPSGALFYFSPFYAFDDVNFCSFYVIKMNAPTDFPIQYKMSSGGQVVDTILKDAQGLLFVDEQGLGLIPTRVRPNYVIPMGFEDKIELILSAQYQHTCSDGDQKYRFLDTEYMFSQQIIVPFSIDLSKKYVRANDVIEVNITRADTDAEVQYLVFSYARLSDLAQNKIDTDILRAVEFFDLMPESSEGVELFESYDGNTITDRIYKLTFAEDEVEKKVVLRVKNREILSRLNILIQLNDDNNLEFLKLHYSNNFVLEKNIPQPTYILSYNILGLTLTISLETTLVPEDTHVAWNITNYEGDPISPNDMSGEFVIGADGHAEVVFAIPNLGDAFSFSFNLTGREEYVGVKRD